MGSATNLGSWTGLVKTADRRRIARRSAALVTNDRTTSPLPHVDNPIRITATDFLNG